MMSRIYVPSLGPSDWRRLLADPQKQWREKKSAYESAVAWEAARHEARGLPPAIAQVLDSRDEFRGASLLMGFPEHRVELAGGGHASQTDFWALILAPVGVTSLAVEAKAGEPFDRPVREWLADARAPKRRSSRRSGKPDRLRQLCELLGLAEELTHDCRYQLLHRAAAAIIEAQRFQLRTAMLLVHAFGDNNDSLADYRRWAQLFGVDGDANHLDAAGSRSGVSLWIGWVAADCATDLAVRSAL